MSPPPALRPLRHRDFRLLWTGLAISLAGDGIWLVALAWQVIELGGGPVQLSIVTTAYSLGLIGFVLPGGVVADRLPRRAVMIVADLVRAVAVALVAGLSLAGEVELWQLAVGGFVIGAGEAFFVPSYTALVPRLLPDDQILAANGLEGVLRPLAHQALGPAVGGLAVATLEPGAAILTVAVTYLFSAACLTAMRTSGRPDRLAEGAEAPSPLSDLREAAAYVRRTSWLWATLMFAMVAVFFYVGPLDVLVPFAVRDQAGGDAADFGLVLAVFGIGSAIGALAISSRPLPRRYLSWMLLAWSVGFLPFAVFGFAEALWVMCAAALILGISEAVGMVVWGTLLQRRVPDELRGRVSGLDFFVSLALTPLSMALAGPAGEAFGLSAVFVAAAVIPIGVAAFAYRAGRLHSDELAHPLI